METNIEKLLRDELKDEIVCLKDLELGSEKYKVAVDGISKLTDRTIELAKIEIECENKFKHLEKEMNLKIEQMNDERTDRWIKNGLTAAGILIPAALAVWGTKASFEFEKEGTITTILGRGFIQKLLPKK